MRRAGLFVTMLLVLLLTASSASAAPGVVQDLAGCDTNTLAANDDGSTDGGAARLHRADVRHEFSAVFVNNNGNVTFDRAPVDVHAVRLPRDRRADHRAVLRRRRHPRRGFGVVHYGADDRTTAGRRSA